MHGGNHACTIPCFELESSQCSNITCNKGLTSDDANHNVATGWILEYSTQQSEDSMWETQGATWWTSVSSSQQPTVTVSNRQACSLTTCTHGSNWTVFSHLHANISDTSRQLPHWVVCHLTTGRRHFHYSDRALNLQQVPTSSKEFSPFCHHLLRVVVSGEDNLSKPNMASSYREW